MDGGVETITDDMEKAALRKQALGVRLRSLALAVVLTGACWAWP